MPASSDFLKSNHASTLPKRNIKLSTGHKTCFKMHELFLQSYFYGYRLKQEEWKAIKSIHRMNGLSATYHIQ